MWKFLDAVEFDVYGADFDVRGKAQVSWEMDLELRSWGMKSIEVVVPDQKVRVCKITTDAEGDEHESEVEIDLKDVAVEMPSDTSAMSLKSLEFYNGRWTAHF